jgi:hypothetical protein
MMRTTTLVLLRKFRMRHREDQPAIIRAELALSREL